MERQSEIEFAKEEAWEEGREEGKLDVAKQIKKKGTVVATS